MGGTINRRFHDRLGWSGLLGRAIYCLDRGQRLPMTAQPQETTVRLGTRGDRIVASGSGPGGTLDFGNLARTIFAARAFAFHKLRYGNARLVKRVSDEARRIEFERDGSTARDEISLDGVSATPLRHDDRASCRGPPASASPGRSPVGGFFFRLRRRQALDGTTVPCFLPLCGGRDRRNRPPHPSAHGALPTFLEFHICPRGTPRPSISSRYRARGGR